MINEQRKARLEYYKYHLEVGVNNSAEVGNI